MYINNKHQPLCRSKILPYFDFGVILLLSVQVKTRDMLHKLQNRALGVVLNREIRHNVLELHPKALSPFFDDRSTCHLANFVFGRKKYAMVYSMLQIGS